MRKLRKKSKGFTAIEAVLVIAIIGILFGISAPSFQRLYLQNELSLAADGLTQYIRRAQSLAQSGLIDTNWGVRVESNEVVVYGGPDYANRFSGTETTQELSPSITPSGISEISFEKITGTPTTTGTFTLTSTNSQVRNITVNEYGMVEN